MRLRNFLIVVFFLGLQITFLSLGERSAAGILGFLRLFTALVCILYLPGYAILTAFLTPSGILNTVQRIAISTSLSVAIIPILSLILAPTPWGIKTWPMAIGLSAITLGMALIALIRWYRLKPEQRLPEPG
jgi:uncharacterized membrane protein